MPTSVQDTVHMHVEQGMTPAQIAPLVGLTTNGVRDRLKRAGVYQPRPYGQNSRARGVHVDGQGYAYESVGPDWQFFDAMARKMKNRGKVAQHRKVVADHLGRALLPTETVHHLDGDRTNNVIENLQLRQGRHGKGVSMRCRCCGSTDIEAVEV